MNEQTNVLYRFSGQFHLSSVLLWLYSILFMLSKQLGLLVINACNIFYLVGWLVGWLLHECLEEIQIIYHICCRSCVRKWLFDVYLCSLPEYNIIFVCHSPFLPPSQLHFQFSFLVWNSMRCFNSSCFCEFPILQTIVKRTLLS